LRKILVLACTTSGALWLIVGAVVLVPGEEHLALDNGMGGPVESLPPPRSMELTRETTTSPFAVVPEDTAQGTRRVDFQILRRQSFYEALQALDAPHDDIMTLVAVIKPFRDLRKVKRGDSFWLRQHPDGGIDALGFDLDEESYVDFERNSDGYEMFQGAHPVEHRVRGVSGEITESLYSSLQDCHAPLSLAAKMNDVLGWEIDFSRDLRRGDSFRMVYEEVWKDGEFVRTGPILALECINRGDVHRAYRFAGLDGRPAYFDPDGENFQKMLMRAPLEYSRVSSGFSYRRFHPVLKRWMPHLGVDYAAPVGTPIRAAGDGTIVEIGRKKGNGRYVKIRHTNREYESYYLHLSRFAKGMKKGVNVKQGKVIGYVGATGYATGPHLDYRVRRNGRFVNPRQLKLPAAAPVAESDRSAFVQVTELLGESLAELPVTTDDGPVPVDSISLDAPPRWDPSVFVTMVPELLRPH